MLKKKWTNVCYDYEINKSQLYVKKGYLSSQSIGHFWDIFIWVSYVISMPDRSNRRGLHVIANMTIVSTLKWIHLDVSYKGGKPPSSNMTKCRPSLIRNSMVQCLQLVNVVIKALNFFKEWETFPWNVSPAIEILKRIIFCIHTTLSFH